MSDDNEITILPDGSAFFTASIPLPDDHWLYQLSAEFGDPPPMPMRLGTDHPQHGQFVEWIWQATKHALRASTGNGTIDMDPDALCQNMVVALIGYHTDDGLSSDDWGNPDPVPPIWKSTQ